MIEDQPKPIIQIESFLEALGGVNQKPASIVAEDFLAQSRKPDAGVLRIRGGILTHQFLRSSRQPFLGIT